MITDSLDFPCIEASRCYLTEKEHGLRLSLTRNKGKNKKQEDDDDNFKLSFTKHRGKNEEWYVHLYETTSAEKNGRNRKSLRLCHCATGQYLSSQEDGRVVTLPTASEESSWWMESVASSPTRNRVVYFSLVSQSHAPGVMAYTSAVPTWDDEESFAVLNTTTSGDQTAVWELEFTSGELCFISNPVVHAQIRCNPFGHLSLNHKMLGWEVFRFIELGNGDVAISSWTHSHKYLSSDTDGRVFTTENRLGSWEKWRLEKTEHGVYILSVAHEGRYLSVGRQDDEPLHTTTKPNDFCKWHLDAAHSHTYYITSADSYSKGESHLVSSSRRGPFVTKHRRNWEEWRMERNPEGYITLFSVVHQKYLGSNASGDTHTTTSKGEWSLWEMEESPHNGIFLKSKNHQRLLSYDGDKLYTAEEQYTMTETWRLEPRLPPSISGSKIIALSAAGAVGLALTVAMPYAVLGAYEAAGLAAFGFSAEALAGFGGGALLGASVVGSTAAFVDDTNDSEMSPTAKNREEYLTNALRPISAWRTW